MNARSTRSPLRKPEPTTRSLCDALGQEARGGARAGPRAGCAKEQGAGGNGQGHPHLARQISPPMPKTARRRSRAAQRRPSSIAPLDAERIDAIKGLDAIRKLKDLVGTVTARGAAPTVCASSACGCRSASSG